MKSLSILKAIRGAVDLEAVEDLSDAILDAMCEEKSVQYPLRKKHNGLLAKEL